MEKTKREYLWLVFFLIVFINGFEAGGYQASLLNIGQTYELSTASKGIFASVELFATMLAPILLGAWADRNSKVKCLRILLCIQLAAAFDFVVYISGDVCWRCFLLRTDYQCIAVHSNSSTC